MDAEMKSPLVGALSSVPSFQACSQNSRSCFTWPTGLLILPSQFMQLHFPQNDVVLNSAMCPKQCRQVTVNHKFCTCGTGTVITVHFSFALMTLWA